jgi:thioester reductase-like protein
MSLLPRPKGNTESQMNSIIAYLEHWVAVQPGKCYSSFLDVHGKETDSYTYLGFYERSRYLAEYLSCQVGMKRGDRALLVYPPGLEVIVAFFACARIGVIPVPVYPPTQTSFQKGLTQVTFIAHDCQARVALTTHGFHRSYQLFSEERLTESLLSSTLALPYLDWVTTDDVKGQASQSFGYESNPVLFLQYTSGSTSDPKGVIVSHENVIHNCLATVDHQPTGVSWLPQYHDMGLIGYYLYPVITGGTTYGFSPTDFLKRPGLWLQTLSRFQATCGSSPNFGFDYCLREDKIPSDQLADLDLSSLRFLMNASEPARPETYRRFLERFAPYGLRPQAHVVAYGLAENTLAVTNYGRRIVTVNKRRLQEGTSQPENAEIPNSNQLRLASCGKPLDGIRVRIVDPKSGAVLGNQQIGEVWVAGKSTCQGYWNRPELTKEVFGNAVTNDPRDHNSYLRSGDVGFLDDDELFICGRIKDLIIIRGVNYYPQDIESIVESASPKIRRGGVAALDGNEQREGLVVMAEVRKAKDLPDPNQISQAIHTQYNIRPNAIVFVAARSIARTTSGKIARSLTRQRWLGGKLRVIATHYMGAEGGLIGPAHQGLRGRFGHFLEQYHLTGYEECTLAEIGIDSLAMVTLLDDIEMLLKDHGASDLLSDIDGRLLQRLTVAEFSSLFEQLEKVSEKQIAAFQSVLKKLRQDHDDQQRDCMRYDTRLRWTNRVDITLNEEPLTSVLLSGPTGFFGPFLLNTLLRQTSYNYFTLTRASDPVHGMNRIRASLQRARVWTPALDEELKNRVHVVCGDISQYNLGMRSELWQSLSTRVQAVIHNAALVNYVLNYDAVRPHNVNGTRELLRFSCTGTRKEFHFISSTIIFGWTVKGELLETDNNEDMSNLDFGYAQSKWVAEQLVFAAENEGLKVRVYRPSFITASAGGIGSRDDIVVRLLAFMINNGIAVHAANQISFLPGNIAADNIVGIFKQRDLTARTFHVTADDYYNMMDITRLISSQYGYQFVYYDIPDFVAEVKRRCTKDDLLYPLLDFFTRSHEQIAAIQHKRYNNDHYRKARQLSRNDCGDPLLTDTVSYLMAFMLREGLIAARARAQKARVSV